MLLAIDVGNTNIVLGLFEERNLVRSWRLETNQRKSADEYAASIRQLLRAEGYVMDVVESVVISTVVPTLTYTLQHMSSKYFGCTALVVTNETKSGLVIEYDDPKALGADRIVNAAAAHAFYGGNVIVIDYGTATTYCAVTKDGIYLGGVICPGIKISSDALFEKTSKLPKIEIAAPEHAIGKNTIECMQSGVVFGAVGETEYLVAAIKKELAQKCGSEDITVIATGGLSNVVANYSKSIDVIDKELTLKGLEYLWELNS